MAISKNRLNFLRSLHERKNRTTEKSFLAEGTKAVLELLTTPADIIELFATEKWLLEHQISTSVPISTLSERELDLASSLSSPQPVIALVKMQERVFDKKVLKEELILLLDEIKDPGNMGTIIRICDWFGIQHVICSPGTVDVYNSKVVQSTMGSILRVGVYYQHLNELLTYCKEEAITVYGALLEGENIFKSDLKSTGVIVLGNESKGIAGELRRYISHPVKIPSYQGGAESLNVGVAAGIICAEFRRKNFLK